MRFLHADDEDIWRGIISRLLVDAGHQVDSVASGEDVFERLEVVPYDAVITDNNMGSRRKSGLDVLTEIRAEVRWASLPVIVLSGDTVVEDFVKENGGLFVCKLNAREDLLACIRQIK